MIVAGLDHAERPIAVVGGPVWSVAQVDAFRRMAEAWQLPVVTAFRRQDLFDNASELYVGTIGLNAHPHVAEALRTADLLLIVGGPLDPMSRSALAGLGVPTLTSTPDYAPRGRGDKLWGDWHSRFLQVIDEGDLAPAVRHLNTRLPEAIVTMGAGTFSILPQRNWVYRSYPSQGGPQAGSMGYAIPAALAAKLAFPDRPVIAFTGDGDFLMNGQELATAVQYAAPFLVVLINNGTYGTIRAHQELRYPGRLYGVDLLNPDFAAYAEAFGAYGKALDGIDGFPAALDEALDAIRRGRPALLEIRVPVLKTAVGEFVSELD